MHSIYMPTNPDKFLVSVNLFLKIEKSQILIVESKEADII